MSPEPFEGFPEADRLPVAGGQADVGPARCECTIVHSSSRVVVTAITSHEAALAVRARGAAGFFNFLIAGPHADIWRTSSGRVGFNSSAMCINGHCWYQEHQNFAPGEGCYRLHQPCLPSVDSDVTAK